MVQNNLHGGGSQDLGSDFLTDPGFGDEPRFTHHEIEALLQPFQDSILATVDKSIEKMVSSLTAHFPPRPISVPSTQRVTESSQSRLLKPPKITGFPVRRSREECERQVRIQPRALISWKSDLLFLLWVQRLVREHMGRLVGKDISKAVVSDPEIKQFKAQWKEDQSRDCCTVESFRINLKGPPKSPWNISAARVFARSYIHRHQLDSDPKTLLAISQCATTRIKSLRYKLKKLSLTAPERLEFEAAARRRGRKATVSNITLSLQIQG